MAKGDGPVPKEQQMEAIKLLADWSKWLVTVETAGAVALFSLVNLRPGHFVTLWGFPVVPAITVIAVMFFAYSAHNAAKVLVSLPDITQNLHGKWRTEDDIYEMKDADMKKLRLYVIPQFKYFKIGLFFVLLAALAMLWPA